MPAGSAPDPARPDALSATGTASGTAASANMSPPKPHMCGDVTAITAAAAIAASAALPPRSSIDKPAEAARWLAAATAPSGAYLVSTARTMTAGSDRSRGAGASG